MRRCMPLEVLFCLLRPRRHLAINERGNVGTNQLGTLLGRVRDHLATPYRNKPQLIQGITTKAAHRSSDIFDIEFLLQLACRALFDVRCYQH